MFRLHTISACGVFGNVENISKIKNKKNPFLSYHPLFLGVENKWEILFGNPRFFFFYFSLGKTNDAPLDEKWKIIFL